MKFNQPQGHWQDFFICVLKMFAVCVPCLALKKMFFIVKSMKDCVAILSTAGAPLISVYVHVCVWCVSSVCKPLPVSNQHVACVKCMCVWKADRRGYEWRYEVISCLLSEGLYFIFIFGWECTANKNRTAAKELLAFSPLAEKINSQIFTFNWK